MTDVILLILDESQIAVMILFVIKVWSELRKQEEDLVNLRSGFLQDVSSKDKRLRRIEKKLREMNKS